LSEITVLVESNSVEHDHEIKKRGLNAATKDFIITLYSKDIRKPTYIKNNILANLEKNPELSEPSILQIKYQISKLKKEKV
jgi:hypothetical protein